MIRVMIVTNHPEVREGLCTVLELIECLQVTGCTGSLSQVIQQSCHTYPDVVLIDVEMPGGEGYEIIRQLGRLCPCAKTIALTAHDYPAARETALRAGASAVMVKGLDVAEMIAIIRKTAGA